MICQNRSFFVFSHHLTVFNSNQNIYLTRINTYNQAVFGTRLLKPLRSKSTKSSSQSSLDGAKMLLPGRSKTEHWPRSKLREVEAAVAESQQSELLLIFPSDFGNKNNNKTENMVVTTAAAHSQFCSNNGN